jgi:hypothetical protein
MPLYGIYALPALALLPPLLPTTGALSVGCPTRVVVLTATVVAAFVLTTGPAFANVGLFTGVPWLVVVTVVMVTGGCCDALAAAAAGPLVGSSATPLGGASETARPIVTAVSTAASLALASRPAMVCCRCLRVRAAWAPGCTCSSNGSSSSVSYSCSCDEQKAAAGSFIQKAL